MSKFFKFLGVKGSILFFIFFMVTIVAVQNLSQAVSLSFLFWDIAAFSILHLILVCLFLGAITGFVLASRKKVTQVPENTEPDQEV